MSEEEAFTQYESLLRRSDEPDAAEFPARFDSRALNARVRKVHRQLEARLGRSLRLEDGAMIQDASFHADIELVRRSVGNTLVACAVRFSNFGSLATVTMEEEASEADLEFARQTLNEEGFVFVPADILDREYDGCAPTEWQIQTWWDRFFDYL